MRILELRKGSAEETELLEAAAAAHGDWVMAAAALMQRLWLMRSAWAPGLRYIGGLAHAPDVDAGPASAPLSVGGAGLRLEDALAGCLAEAVERTAQIERDGDVVLSAPLDAVDIPDQIGELIDLVLAHDRAATRGPIDWVRARDVVTGAETLVPADWCLRRRKPTVLGVPGAALSTGCAAATSAQEALVRGLLELIERDAASLWWLAGQPPTRLRPDSPEAAAFLRLRAELRQSESPRRITRVLDITSDLSVPVMAAIAHHADGTGLAIGLAARPSPARAAGRALIELCQMELGLELAVDKRAQIGEAALTDADRRHLERATAQVADLPMLAATDTPRHQRMTTDRADRIGHLSAALVQVDAAAWHVDLTRADSGLNVVKAIAPRLQPMPADLETARLSSVRRAHTNAPRAPLRLM
ncbi:MAG: YcaO-like family protein [Hyphomicrobiaceae bacterium]